MLVSVLLYLCLAGSSLQAAAGSSPEQDFSKETNDSRKNMTVSQTSRLESTHRQPLLTGLEKCEIWSERKAKYLDNVTVF